MKQTSFAQAEFAAKKKTTRRERFLAEMEQAVPWSRLLKALSPYYYPDSRAGRPHERNAQFSVTTVEPLNYQPTTDFDGLGKHRNLPVLLPTLGQGLWHQTTQKVQH